MKLDDNNLSKALKFAKRCHEKYLNDEFVDEEPSKKGFRESGGERKCKAPEVREAMLEWCINVRGVLKGPLPIKMFRFSKPPSPSSPPPHLLYFTQTSNSPAY